MMPTETERRRVDVSPDRAGEIGHLALEQWAEWFSRGREMRNLGYGDSILARALRSMPGTRCPTCNGKGGLDGARCPICHGAGRVVLDKPDGKANPAFISGKGRKADPAPPPEVERVDRAVRREPIGVRVCVFAEYFGAGGRLLEERHRNANRTLRRAGEPAIAARTYQGRLTAFRRRLGATLVREKITRTVEF